MERIQREVDVTLAGQSNTDPFLGTTSAARGAMYVTHMGQAPIPLDNEPRRIITGTELHYADYTFDIRFPVAATVLGVIRKYPTGIGAGSIRHNPVTTIIYEDYYDPFKTIGIIHVPEYASFHQDFGYRYEKRSDVWDRLGQGAQFDKDEVIASSPAVKQDGTYGIGLNAKTVFMSMPGTIEDGFIMSESMLKRLTPTVYNSVTANCGRKAFLLNLYGDEKNYKPFPDIGERIRDDGVVFALRDLDDILSPADMTSRALRTVDHSFDRRVIGKPGARVVDINVFHDNRTNPAYTPVGMDSQMRKYYDTHCNYYREVINTYNRLKARRPNGTLKITPEFNQLLVEAQIYLPVQEGTRKLNRMYRLEPLDEWRIEVTYEAQMTPNPGYKATDMHGGKGVICKVMKDEDMPIDENGNRAEVIIYGGSTIRRMNFGRMYEHFFNAAGRDLTHRMRREAGLNPHHKPTTYQLAQVKANTELVDRFWDLLMRYYQLIVPLQYDALVNDPDRARHVTHVLKDGIYLWMPPNNPTNLRLSAKAVMESEFCPHYGKVEYTNNQGVRVKTVKNILVGDLYMIMLEKIGEDWSGVASVKTQQFGLPSKLNNMDKLSTPGREQPVRSMGESETRSYICTVGPEATNELLDQTNNPSSHRYAVAHILRAAKPTNIDKIVDRIAVPYGGSRPVGLAQHLLECRGIRFVYKPDQ